MKETIDKLNIIKIQNYFSSKDNIKTIKIETTDKEKIVAKNTSNKELLSKICEELLKLNSKERNSKCLLSQSNMGQRP